MSQPQGALANPYFLGHHPDDKAEWQGQVIAPVGADFYLAQLFDPATGAPAHMVIIPIDRIAAYRWALYSSAEEWRRAMSIAGGRSRPRQPGRERRRPGDCGPGGVLDDSNGDGVAARYGLR